ncbi:Retrovirus-related Pol polyprotein from transposon TNT 1-94 [Quillaja saponaria]|uniref:Retrovirus-related Pol polyprotein from transposon TNT 1-94 n=1 Tax=Quillaja saponaria TaxID=32244 RepID=A0AAD7M2X8_QUISA|nr:Retrovirus-related Pol polyprotein from transposon TNT 1-94 [Quillaja saponaria]
MSTYLGKIQNVKAELAEILPLTTDLADQEAQRDKLFMILTLYGLRADLDPVRHQILASLSIPSMEEVFARLLRISSPAVTHVENPYPDSSVLISHSSTREGHGRGSRGSGRPQCTHCNRMGHIRKKCYQLIGYPGTTANIVQSANSLEVSPSKDKPLNVSLSATKYDKFLQYQATQQSSHGNSVACLSQTSYDTWIIDSGASDHISGNPKRFSSISNPSSLFTVTIANGSTTIAKGIGQATPLSSLPLETVLYVPECSFSLISISQLTRSLNCSVTFIDDSFTIQDRRTGRTIGTGRESHGLYHLTTLPTYSVACSTDVSPILIHSRLGHPSLSKLQKMVPRLSSLSSLNCESCQLGKHTRASFPKHSRFRAESPFHLVHTDVWGHSRVSSSLGFQYFVTFIDDYSRCTWLFLMKNRSELFSIFQQFCAKIKTQFGVSIRILRSDNAREYFSTSFQHFMTSQGMLHQSSCSHTPQQNGVAERKNRHLIETARTLLLHDHVPLRFWGDAVLTACYLINRMPSSTLHNKISYSIIFPNHPLYSLPLCIFGCICFVHDLTPRHDKLSSKSFKCIFLGYSRIQKGYKCYNLDKYRYFISADVTFFEESSFFSSIIPESHSISKVFSVPYLGPNDYVSSSPLPDLPADTVDVPDDSPSVPTPSRTSDPISPPILRRGTRLTCNPYPIYTFLSYHRLSSPYYTFVSSLSSIYVPKSTSDALAHPK